MNTVVNPFDDTPPTPATPAERVIAKFGGAYKLAAALGRVDGRKRVVTSVYRWTYPREKGGTGGYIPAAMVPTVMSAARLEGIFLEAGDFYPGIVG